MMVRRRGMRLRWFLLGVLSSLAVAGIGGAVVLRNARGFSARAAAQRDRSMVRPRVPVRRASGRRLGPARIPCPTRLRRSPRPWPIGPTTARPVMPMTAPAIPSSGSARTRQRRICGCPPRSSSPTASSFTSSKTASGSRPCPLGAADSDEHESWKLVHFIRHLPQLTDAEKAEMQKLNPKTLQQLKEDWKTKSS